MSRKLCRDCFEAEFPGVRYGIVTWGRECTSCHKQTPISTNLIKVEEPQP